MVGLSEDETRDTGQSERKRERQMVIGHTWGCGRRGGRYGGGADGGADGGASGGASDAVERPGVWKA